MENEERDCGSLGWCMSISNRRKKKWWWTMGESNDDGGAVVGGWLGGYQGEERERTVGERWWHFGMVGGKRGRGYKPIRDFF